MPCIRFPLFKQSGPSCVVLVLLFASVVARLLSFREKSATFWLVFCFLVISLRFFWWKDLHNVALFLYQKGIIVSREFVWKLCNYGLLLNSRFLKLLLLTVVNSFRIFSSVNVHIYVFLQIIVSLENGMDIKQSLKFPHFRI